MSIISRSLFDGALYSSVDIYLDESGDLGFTSPRSSQYLVVAAVATTDSTYLSRIPRKARKKLHIKGMDKEIKFSNSSEEIRRYVLNEINKLDCWVVWGAITKKNAISQLRKNSAYLYNYLCGLVLCDMFERTHTKKINLIFDRHTIKKGNRDKLDSYINEKLKSRHSGHFVPELRISHYDSINCQCLQAHDFIVGSVFQSIERNDMMYLDLISSKVVKGEIHW